MYNYINDDNTIIFDHGHDEPLAPKSVISPSPNPSC